MSALYKVRALVVCDDIRREASGKLSLMGTYNSVIVLSAPAPATLPMLSFWIELDVKKKAFDNVAFRLLAPSGRPVFEGSGGVEFPHLGEPGSISLTAAPIQLPELGHYKFQLGMDQKPRTIGMILVRIGNEALSPAPAAGVAMASAQPAEATLKTHRRKKSRRIRISRARH
jgi:hypothetical protein